MIKVDIIYSGDIYAPNGASVLMKRLMETKELFKEYQIEQRVFSPSILKKQPNKGGESQQSKLTWTKKIVRSISKHSLLVSFLRYRRSYINPAQEAVKQYESLSEKGDVVVFHETWTCYEYLKRDKGQEKKVILIIHGDGDSLFVEMPRFDSVLLTSYKKRIKETILNNCHKIGFDADYPRQRFCKKFGFDVSKSFYVYNGIDIRPCPQIDDYSKLKVICVASLSNRKNQEGILNALKLLEPEDQKRVELVLVGDGSIRESLEKMTQSLSATVSFVGTMSENQYYELLLKSNCFCLFSKSEGLPIAVIEGMRAGLPVIGSRVAGIPEEITDGVTGFVVDLDERELSDKFKWMIANLEKLPVMGRSSYGLFRERFTTEAMIKKYVEVYNS